jgi:hypothetical protein
VQPYEAMEVYLHTFLNSALDGGEWLSSHLAYFSPNNNIRAGVPIGFEDWEDMVGLDAVARRRVLPCWEVNPGRPAHCLVTVLTDIIRL